MKKVILISIICFISFNANSQILEWYEEIKDAVQATQIEVIAGLEEAGNAEKAKENKENVKITKEIIKQKETLNELKELMNSVSAALKTYSVLKNCFLYLKETVVLYKEISSKTRNLKTSDGNKVMTTDEMIRLNNIMFSIVNKQKDHIKDIKLIVNKDKTKMSEGQRINLLYGVESDMKTTYYELNEFKFLINY